MSARRWCRRSRGAASTPAPDRLTWGLTAAIAACVSARADAHGPAPAVYNIWGAEPAALGLGRGFAVRDGARWRYACPSAWGGPDAPLATYTPALGLWVYGDEGAVALDPTGIPSRIAGGDDWTALAVRDMASSGERVSLLLDRADAAQRVVQVDASTTDVVAELQNRWESIAVIGDDVLVAGTRAGQAVLVRLDVETASASEARLPGPSDVRSVDVRVAAERVFVVAQRADAYLLYEVDETGTIDWVRSASPIHGPVAGPPGAPSAMLLATAGVVRALDDETRTSDPGIRVTCLVASGDTPFACAQEDLFSVGADLGLTRVWSHAELQAPNADALAAPLRTACAAEWADYALHAGSVDPDAGAADAGVADAGDMRARDRGCSVARVPAWRAAAAVGAWALMVACTRRRMDPQHREVPRRDGPC